MTLRPASCLALAIGLASCASLPPPSTVPAVDLARYAGDWYEVESFPAWFQRGCTGTKATYTPLPNGKIRVVNTCQRGGRETSITGTARVVPGSNNSKLKVTFFRPFEGDYWILDLDPDYRFMAVGHPSRDYGWIMAREKRMTDADYAKVLSALEAQGYDPARFRKVPQSGGQ